MELAFFRSSAKRLRVLSRTAPRKLLGSLAWISAQELAIGECFKFTTAWLLIRLLRVRDLRVAN